MACSREVPYLNPGAGGVVVADFNGDGAQDLATRGSGAATAAISVYLNTPTLALYPGSLNFGAQVQGVASTAQDVTLSNPGSMPLAISGISAGGDYGVVNSCGSALVIGTNCNVGVTFTPTETGARNNSLQVTDNALGSPQTV